MPLGKAARLKRPDVAIDSGAIPGAAILRNYRMH